MNKIDRIDGIDGMRTVTLGEVEAAFEVLLEVVGRECDAPTAQTVYWVRVDVMDILAGKWRDRASDELRVTSDERPEEGPDTTRCPECNQSLRDIENSMFACPSCFETFGDEAVEAALPF